MRYALIISLIVIFLIATKSSVIAAAAYCTGGTISGSQIVDCKFVYPGGGAQGYCGQFRGNGSCSCGPPSCTCSPGGFASCVVTGTDIPTSTCVCSNGKGSACTSDGNTCGTTLYPGVCGCTDTYPPGSSNPQQCVPVGSAVLNCSTTAPTGTPVPTTRPTTRPPGPTSPPGATNTPIPTATPVLSPTCASAGPPSNPPVSWNTTSYNVFAYGVANATNVSFRAWSSDGGQDDLVPYAGVNQGGGTWRATIPFAAHTDDGQFFVNVWMNSNSVLCGTAHFTRDPVPSATPVVPTLTPTPAIIGQIYDANGGPVGTPGGLCTWTGGSGDPTPIPVSSLVGANVQAISSGGVTSNGSITGSTYTIVNGLVSSGTYQVSLNLPQPDSNSTFTYICDCPVGGDDYQCQYSGISANGSPNFFVKQNTLANAWWQTVGGSVYAKNTIQTQIPVNTCNADNSCTSALIVGTGDENSNTSGFAMLGAGGLLKTTTTGETGYVQSSGNRSTSNGAYAIGVKPGNETYDYFTRNLNQTPVDVANLAELRTKIGALPASTTGIFRYTGGGNLAIDASNPLIILPSRRVVVFAPEGIILSNANNLASPQLTTVPVGSFLMFLTQGNITITQALGYTNPDTVPTATNANLTGVFVANGQIIIQSDGDTNIADRKFIGAGTFVGWDNQNVGTGLLLQRNFADSVSGLTQNSVTPAEVFVYRPDFVATFPTELKAAHFNWQELAPQKVGE